MTLIARTIFILMLALAPAGKLIAQEAPAAEAENPSTGRHYEVREQLTRASGDPQEPALLPGPVPQPRAGPELALGAIGLCVGAGFIASAFVSLQLSRRLGLWEDGGPVRELTQ